MKIVTTPMCEEIVKLAGITDYSINKFPTENDGDFAVLLSESKVAMDSLPIKINTSKQIFKSIKQVSELAGNELDDSQIRTFFKDYPLCEKYLNAHFKRNIDVKVYSQFLKDIVADAGFNIVLKDFKYVIYPDYMENKVSERENLITIPSHNSISKNPFEKAEARYRILEKLI